MPCLRMLQSTLVYVNTLMLQDIPGEPEWADLHARPPKRPGPALLAPCPALRRGQPRHGRPPQPRRGRGTRAPADRPARSSTENA